MGHVRLGVLSRSKKWQQVVEELRLGAGVDTIAASAADAAEASLQGASDDPALLHTFWLLTQIPLAARGPAFAEDLLRLGLQVPDKPSLMDVAAAFSGAVDRYARERKERTDLGEMAQMAAIERLLGMLRIDSAEMLRRHVLRCRKKINRLATKAGDALPSIDAVIETSQRHGYRLNPDTVRIVAITELTARKKITLRDPKGHAS